MEDCIFCKIIKKEIPSDIIYEDNDVFAFLDIKPLNPGHSLVVPKEHHTDLFDSNDETLAMILPVIKKLGNAIKKVTSADGIGIGQNNGKAAGQVIFHTHFHIIPRYINDGYKSWNRREDPENKNTKDLAEKIKKEI